MNDHRPWGGVPIEASLGRGPGCASQRSPTMLTKGRVGYFIEWQSDDDDRDADKALFERIYKSFKPRS